MRAPCSWTQRSPSVTVRRARSRRPRPVASSSLDSKASRSRVSVGDVGLCESCHRAPLSSALCRSSSGAARRPSCRASSATTPAARSRASRTPAPVTISVAAHSARPWRVVGERLVGAEEAGHQTQRPGAAHHVLAEDVQHTSRRAHVLVDAGAPRRPVDRRRRRVAHGPVQQFHDVEPARPVDRRRRLAGQAGVDLEELRPVAADHHLDVHEAVQAEALGDAHGGGVEGGEDAGGDGGVPGAGAAGAGGRRLPGRLRPRAPPRAGSRRRRRTRDP